MKRKGPSARCATAASTPAATHWGRRRAGPRPPTIFDATYRNILHAATGEGGGGGDLKAPLARPQRRAVALRSQLSTPAANDHAAYAGNADKGIVVMVVVVMGVGMVMVVMMVIVVGWVTIRINRGWW